MARPGASSTRRLGLLATLAAAALLAAPEAGAAVRITGAPPGVTASRDAVVAFRATPAGTATCSLDGRPARPCRTPLRLRALPAGAHRVVVRAGGGRAVVRWTASPILPAGGRGALDAADRGGPLAEIEDATVAALSAPRPGAVLRGVTRLAASAALLAGRVAWVDFVVDGRVVASDNRPPYAAWWDAASVRGGTHRFEVAAWDGSGGRRVSVAVAARTDPVGRYDAVGVPGEPLGAPLRRLGRDGGSLYLPAGVYAAAGARVASGVRLIGSGPGTVLRVPAGAREGALQIEGDDVVVSDLTVDANGPAQGGGHGWAVEVRPGSADVRLRRVRILRPQRYGVYAWGDHAGVSLEDSLVDGGGTASAAFFDQAGPRSADQAVLRSTLRRVRDYGISFNTTLDGVPYASPRALAFGNVIRAVSNPDVDDGTSEAGIWSGGEDAVLVANTIDGTGWDGIQTIARADRPRIVANVIRNTPTGIYVEHETRDGLIEGNLISGVVTGVNIEWWYAGAGSLRQTIRGNTITGAGAVGVFADVGAGDNVVVGNVVHDSGEAAVRLRSTGNVVAGNDLRDTRPAPAQLYCVHEDHGRWDDGRLAVPDGNALSGNDCRGSRLGVRVLGPATVVAGNTWP